MNFVLMRQHASGSGRTGPGQRLLFGAQWGSGWAVSGCALLKLLTVRDLMRQVRSQKFSASACTGFFYTAVYMVLTPASWVFTVIIPLIYSLIIFDNPFVSPVVLAMLMASPFKFVPYCPIPLVW